MILDLAILGMSYRITIYLFADQMDVEEQELTCSRLQFRTRDGYEGEGLTEPLIATFNAPPDKWTSYDVTALALQYQDANRCEAGIAPLNCDNGPFLCRFLGGNQGIQANRKKGWSCGIPVIGNRELADLEMPTL